MGAATPTPSNMPTTTKQQAQPHHQATGPAPSNIISHPASKQSESPSHLAPPGVTAGVPPMHGKLCCALKVVMLLLLGLVLLPMHAAAWLHTQADAAHPSSCPACAARRRLRLMLMMLLLLLHVHVHVHVRDVLMVMHPRPFPT